MGVKDRYWSRQIAQLRQRVYGSELPSVSQIAHENADPFRVLLSTIISLRTKDEVTSRASVRLFEIADTPETILKVDEKTIADAIYPAGFYRTKAKQMQACAKIILENHSGRVPSTREELLLLPGVGIKTANLTLNLGFGIDAICVDTHVHRIANRIGWITTKTPEESERALSEVLPQEYWIEINQLLVTYGKRVCTPVSPRCSTCPLHHECSRNRVTRTR
jgi:endonuclease III